MNTLKSVAAAVALAGFVGQSANAALSLTTPSYSQSFDSLAESGTANSWSNDSTLPGWEAVNSVGSNLSTYQAGTGSANAGALWSYGVEGTNALNERALGSLGSGGAYWGSPPANSPAGYYGIVLTNDTGGTITSFTVTYDVEQWRNGGNTTAQPLVSDWAIDVGNWFGTFSAGASTNSPVTVSTAAALDGNAAANRVDEVTFTGNASIAPGQELWIRFREYNDSGNDHGLAIDDFRVNVVVPEPASLGVLALGATGLLARRRRSLCLAE